MVKPIHFGGAHTGLGPCSAARMASVAGPVARPIPAAIKAMHGTMNVQ